MAFSNFIRELLSLQNIIKEVTDNFGNDSEKLKFVSISTVYEYNNVSTVVATSPSMTSTLKHIAIKYHCFRQHVEKELYDLEDRVRKSEGRYFHQRFTR